MTKQRQLILSIIQESDRHLPTEDIYAIAKQRMPSMVLATVYNNLNALTEMNYIRKVVIPGQKAYYDKNIHPHDHIVCDRCGEIADVSVGDLLALLKKRSGMAVSSYELQLHYICDECRAKELAHKEN